jgi:hypothetical protein
VSDVEIRSLLDAGNSMAQVGAMLGGTFIYDVSEVAGGWL